MFKMDIVHVSLKLQCDKSVLLTSTLSNSHSMTRQVQHSTNVECGKIMRNLMAFKFELRHIPS